MDKTHTRKRTRSSAPKVKRKQKTPKVRSKFEGKVAAYMEDIGIKYKYEPTRLSFMVPETDRTYIPDFQLPNGIYVEAKGLFDRDSRKKMLLVTQQHPNLDIRILFMRDNTISKKSKTKYTKWCEENGIACAVSKDGHIPDEWISHKNKKERSK